MALITTKVIYEIPAIIIGSLLAYIIIRSSIKLSRMLNEEESSKLTTKHYSVIKVLDEHPDFINLMEISDFTKIPVGELQSILDCLVRKKRVLKHSDHETYAINRKDVKSHHPGEYDEL